MQPKSLRGASLLLGPGSERARAGTVALAPPLSHGRRREGLLKLDTHAFLQALDRSCGASELGWRPQATPSAK